MKEVNKQLLSTLPTEKDIEKTNIIESSIMQEVKSSFYGQTPSVNILSVIQQFVAFF